MGIIIYAHRFFPVSVPRENTIGVEGVHPWCQGLARITSSIIIRIEVVLCCKLSDEESAAEEYTLG